MIQSSEDLKISLEEGSRIVEKHAQLCQEKLIRCNIGASMLEEVKARLVEWGKNFGSRGHRSD